MHRYLHLNINIRAIAKLVWLVILCGICLACTEVVSLGSLNTVEGMDEADMATTTMSDSDMMIEEVSEQIQGSPQELPIEEDPECTHNRQCADRQICGAEQKCVCCDKDYLVQGPSCEPWGSEGNRDFFCEARIYEDLALLGEECDAFTRCDIRLLCQETGFITPERCQCCWYEGQEFRCSEDLELSALHCDM